MRMNEKNSCQTNHFLKHGGKMCVGTTRFVGCVWVKIHDDKDNRSYWCDDSLISSVDSAPNLLLEALNVLLENVDLLVQRLLLLKAPLDVVFLLLR